MIEYLTADQIVSLLKGIISTCGSCLPIRFYSYNEIFVFVKGEDIYGARCSDMDFVKSIQWLNINLQTGYDYYFTKTTKCVIIQLNDYNFDSRDILEDIMNRYGHCI